MIFILFLYSVCGIVWYILSLFILASDMIDAGISNVKNPVLKFAHDWISLNPSSISIKSIIGIPFWILGWPLSLSFTTLGYIISKL